MKKCHINCVEKTFAFCANIVPKIVKTIEKM